jgi:hypothetical protein
MCEETHGKSDVCMDEVVYDHMMDWCHAMKRKIEHMEEDEKHEETTCDAHHQFSSER